MLLEFLSFFQAKKSRNKLLGDVRQARHGCDSPDMGPFSPLLLQWSACSFPLSHLTRSSASAPSFSPTQRLSPLLSPRKLASPASLAQHRTPSPAGARNNLFVRRKSDVAFQRFSSRTGDSAFPPLHSQPELQLLQIQVPVLIHATAPLHSGIGCAQTHNAQPAMTTIFHGYQSVS